MVFYDGPAKRILLIGSNTFEISKVCLEFLFEGVKYRDNSITEPRKIIDIFKIGRKPILSGDIGIYFSTNASIDELIKRYENLYFFDKEMIKRGYINIIDFNGLRNYMIHYAVGLKQEIEVLADIVRSIAKSNSTRLVIDSISGLFNRIGDIKFIENSIETLAKLFDELDNKIIVTSCKSDELLVSYEDFNRLIMNKLRIDVVKELA